MANLAFYLNLFSLKNELKDVLIDKGHRIHFASSEGDFIAALNSGKYDVACCEVCDNAIITRVQEVAGRDGAPEILFLLVGNNIGFIDNIDLASVWDVICGDGLLQLLEALEGASQYRFQKSSKEASPQLKRDSIIGSSKQLEECLQLASTCAKTDAPVLVTGETGTGKELFARVVHNNSNRASGKFVVVDCASLTESLTESILFGHEKGVFTGASTYRDGLIKIADGGTLFLDEIGELSLNIQKTFLRVLQEKRFRTLGGKNESESNFRLIAATNRDLEMMCDEGRFRSDLLFRLRSVHIKLPPLRERAEDIFHLIVAHANRLCDKYMIKHKKFSRDFFVYLNEHEWPGNVRELINTLEYILSNARDEEIIYPKHLPKDLRASILKKLVGKGASGAALGDGFKEVSIAEASKSLIAGTASRPGTFKEARRVGVSKTEYEYLRSLLAYCGYNIDGACKISGLSRSRIYGLLKKHGLSGRAVYGETA